MNYLILGIALLTFLPILLSMLLGVLRGSRRALLRLILVVLSLVLAYVLCGPIANIGVKADLSKVGVGSDGNTLGDLIVGLLGDVGTVLSDFLMLTAQSFAKVIIFGLLFLVLRILTWLIVYPLCKLFVKPKKVVNSNGDVVKKRHRLLGAGIGLVQGVVIALTICIVANGVLTVVNDGVQSADSLMTTFESVNSDESGSDTSGNASEMFGMVKDQFDEYNGSLFGRMYNAMSPKAVAFISRIKTDKGPVSLPGQIEAIRGLVAITEDLVQIKDLNYEESFYSENNITKLTEILDNVQKTKDSLSKDARTTVNYLITALGDTLQKRLGIDLSILSKFDSIDFAKEAEAFKKLNSFKEKDFSSMTEEQIKQEAKELVKDLTESELMMDLLSNQSNVDLGNGLNDEQRAELDSALDELAAEGTDQESIDRIRDIFNLH